MLNLKKQGLLLSILTATLPLYAEFAPLSYGDEPAVNKVDFTLSHSFGYGLERNQTFFSAAYYYEGSIIKTSAGFQSTDELKDLTFKAAWLPFVFEKQKGTRQLGTNFIYHVQLHDVYTENDFVIGLDYLWKGNSGFLLKTETALIIKETYIDALNEPLNKWDFTASLYAEKKFTRGTAVYFSHAFHSRYRYPSIDTNIFSIGASQLIQSHLRFLADAEFTFTDMIVNVKYLSSAVVNLQWEF
ncbi:MAG: hypothetical protein J5780_05145, partial [Treponema sp.]|nr:hypothetical protein [Treponema sp.]